jgi:ABC-type transport system substrate-binding protein
VSSRPVSANQDADAHEREQAYCQARNLIWDDALSIFPHHQKLPVVTTTRVVGVTMLPNEQFDTVYARPA